MEIDTGWSYGVPTVPSGRLVVPMLTVAEGQASGTEDVWLAAAGLAPAEVAAVVINPGVKISAQISTGTLAHLIAPRSVEEVRYFRCRQMLLIVDPRPSRLS